VRSVCGRSIHFGDFQEFGAKVRSVCGRSIHCNILDSDCSMVA
jgi:hypothetical protein